MLAYALKRFLGAIPTLFIIVTVAFFMMRAAPGGPFDNQRKLPPEIEHNIEVAYNLDKPLIVQYGIYLGRLVRGDLGPSYKNKDFAVAQLIGIGLPVSLRLGLWAMAIALFLGSLMGSWAALHQNGWPDYSVMGAAMAGLRPIIEFMTWNFALLALDQVVNAAAKMLYMSNGQYKMPMVFRGPNGSALQLAAQHSQAWDSWLAHIPGLKVVSPGTPADAKGLLKAAIRDDNPVIVLEGEMLYNTKGEVDENPDLIVPIGKAELKREGEHCTIVTFGKMVLVALQAADQLAKQGVNVDVLDLRTVRPMDVEAIANSVAKTNRAVVVEEGWEVCGIGAQVVDYIQRECFDDLDAPVVRVHQADVPMPYAKNLEKLAKPDAAKTIAAVKRVMYLED